MKTIWKFPINMTACRSTIDVPNAGIARHVGLDPQGQPCLWFEVNPFANTVARAVFVVGTGGDVPDEIATYFASFIQGPFVWHIYLGV